MLKRAYELSRNGDFRGAAQECESEYLRDQSLVCGVEGVDFYVLANEPKEALRFAESVSARLRAFQARVEFFRSLALWDDGRQADALEAVTLALRQGYANWERFRVEWAKRVPSGEIERMIALGSN